MWESTSLPNIFTSFNMFQHLTARTATFALHLSQIIQLPSQNSYLFIVCLNKVVQNKLLYHSPHQIAERSHLVCLRLWSSQRGPPPSGWGSALAPERPGLDSDPELSPEPGTELDMTPLTPGTGQRGNVRIELHVLQGFLYVFLEIRPNLIYTVHPVDFSPQILCFDINYSITQSHRRQYINTSLENAVNQETRCCDAILMQINAKQLVCFLTSVWM